MSEETLPDPATWPGHTGNWNRWPNDLGTLNLVTPEVTRRGIGSVATGQVVSAEPSGDRPGAHSGRRVFRAHHAQCRRMGS